MRMTDDRDLRSGLAPLGTVEPSEEAITTALAAARVGQRGRQRRAVWRFAGATAAVTAALAALTLVPGSSPRQDASRAVSGADLLRSVSGADLLRIASAAAAEQPRARALEGYRYTETLSRWRWTLPQGPEGGLVAVEVEQRVETWVDRHFRGRRVAHQAQPITGDPNLLDDYFVKPSDLPYGYGALPPREVAELPTEPGALREALLRGLRAASTGHPTRHTSSAAEEQYELVQEVLLLLESANATAELRSSLWEVLALVPNVAPAPATRDPLGRRGEAVTIPTRLFGGHGEFTVLFDTETSDLLSWSERGTGGGLPDQSHTILRTAPSPAPDQRPAE